MSYKEDRDWTIVAHAGLNVIRNPSSTVSYEVRSSAMQKTNKQTKTTTRTTTILTHLSKRKVSSWEKLSARGYNDAELSRADSSINYEDRQHFIKEKLKSTAIPLVFNTKYNRNFPMKYIRQVLECHRQEREIENDIPQATHDTKPTVDPENLCDLLVKVKFPTREEGDYSYDDLLRNEEDPPSSPTLLTLQWTGAWEQRFQHVHRFRDNRGPNTPGPTPSGRRQDLKDHSSCPLQADTHGEIYPTSIDDGLRPELIKHMITKDSYIKIHARNISRS